MYGQTLHTQASPDRPEHCTSGHTDGQISSFNLQNITSGHHPTQNERSQENIMLTEPK